MRRHPPPSRHPHPFRIVTIDRVDRGRGTRRARTAAGCLLLGGLFASGLGAFLFPDPSAGFPETWRFLHAAQTRDAITGRASVVDGDTLEIHGRRIRLHGIDAPEAGQRCYRGDAAWRCGQEAANRLAAMIGRRPVTCEARDVDRYGRAVAVCRVDAIDLSAWLVRQGLAVAYRRYSAVYTDEERQAKSVGAGIWSGTFAMPWDWRAARRSGATAGGDRDCRDFSTQRAAQAFFEAAGPGDPHRLDRDGDGTVCEGLP